MGVSNHFSGNSTLSNCYITGYQSSTHNGCSLMFNVVNNNSRVTVINSQILVNQSLVNNISSLLANNISFAYINYTNLTLLCNISALSPGSANYSFGTNSTNATIVFCNSNVSTILQFGSNATFCGLMSYLTNSTI